MQLSKSVAVVLASFLVVGISAVSAQIQYADVAIVHPAHEQTVHDNEGNLVVQVAVEPGLAPGDQIVVLLDGEPIARAPSTMFAFAGVERGAHAVEVQVVDQSGNTLVASQPVTFYMWQASRLFPGRQGK